MWNNLIGEDVLIFSNTINDILTDTVIKSLVNHKLIIFIVSLNDSQNKNKFQNFIWLFYMFLAISTLLNIIYLLKYNY